MRPQIEFNKLPYSCIVFLNRIILNIKHSKMKILSNFIFLCSIFFFNSCGNQSQNQNATTFQSDTGVLMASNDQNLIVDSFDSKTTAEVETNAQNQSENPSNKKAF